MPAVPRVRERVVQPANQFGGLDVRRVLVAEGPALDAEDESELLHFGWQVRSGKATTSRTSRS